MSDGDVAADHDALVEHVIEEIAEHQLLGVDLVVARGIAVVAAKGIMRHARLPPRRRNDMAATVP